MKDTVGTSLGGRIGYFLALSLLFAPFVMLGSSYRSLPLQTPILRAFNMHWVLIAPKSPFIVFRVPLMNLIDGTMVALLLSYAPAFSNLQRRASYSKVFATLLLTIGLKSLFEALEFTLMGVGGGFPRVQHWLAVGTFLCVAGGLALTVWHCRQVPLPWPELKMRRTHKLALAGLFCLHLLIVAESSSLSHRVASVL